MRPATQSWPVHSPAPTRQSSGTDQLRQQDAAAQTAFYRAGPDGDLNLDPAPESPVGTEHCGWFALGIRDPARYGAARWPDRQALFSWESRAAADRPMAEKIVPHFHNT